MTPEALAPPSDRQASLQYLREYVVPYADISSDNLELVQALSWLNATTDGPATSPQQKIEYALEACRTTYTAAARKHQTHHKVIFRSVRDVLAGFSGMNPYLDVSELPQEIRDRIIDFHYAQKKKQIAKDTVENPQLQQALANTGHIAEIMQTFVDNGTVEPLFTELGFPQTRLQLRAVDRFLCDPPNPDSHNGFFSLSRRLLFARWLSEDNMGQFLGDQRISEAAAFILQTQFDQVPAEQRHRLRVMKNFLHEMVGQNNSHLPHTDISLLFHRLALQGQTLASIREYGQQVLMRETRQVRAQTLKPGNYSDQWRKSIDWGGVKFLEAALLPTGQELTIQQFLLNIATQVGDTRRKILSPLR